MIKNVFWYSCKAPIILLNFIFTFTIYPKVAVLAESTMYKELKICLQNPPLTIWFSKLIYVHGKNAYFPLTLKKSFSLMVSRPNEIRKKDGVRF
jgi:hypothetical protein